MVQLWRCFGFWNKPKAKSKEVHKSCFFVVHSPQLLSRCLCESFSEFTRNATAYEHQFVFFFPPMLFSLTPLTRHCPLAAMPLRLLPSSPRWRPSATRVRLLLWTNGTSPSAFCTGSRPSAGQPATTRPDLPSWPLELRPRVCMQPHYHRLGLQGRQPGRPRRQLAPRHRPCSRPSALPWAPSPGAASSWWCSSTWCRWSSASWVAVVPLVLVPAAMLIYIDIVFYAFSR